MNVFIKKKQVLWQKTLAITFFLMISIIAINVFEAPIKNSLYIAVAPFNSFFWNLGNTTHRFLANFFEFQGLGQENDNLKQENQQLLSKILSLQEIIQQQEAFAQVKQNTSQDNFTMVLTQTIGLDSVGDFLLIDKGSEDGILENMPVISSTKVLYGRTVKVYKNFSKVMLISNTNNVLDAKIEDVNMLTPPIFGAIKGNGNFSLYLDLVPSNAPLHTQDVVVTSGQEGIFPRNLLIGSITQSTKNDLKPFQTAPIQPFFDVKNHDTLFIITDYKREK